MTATLSVVIVPESFRFSEVNPLTGVAYAQSRFRDLPGYAADVVEDRLDLCAGEWDVLVDDGEVYDFVGPDESFTVSPHRLPVRKPCQQCSGTGHRPWTCTPCGGCWGQGSYLVVSESDLLVTRRAVVDTVAVVA
ncbi:hypothetical protein [Gandjariella thermophila]|uniref:hypothetical protein n=1 Tax=Gandjariella thermophila TaxID=1931992 RepID=UPI0010F6AE17|nr:hypothetical protein [Gandjariella thermophila]